MLETLLVEANLDLDRGAWQPAEGEFRLALALAEEERDRYQENRSLLGLMEIAAHQERWNDALVKFQLLEDRLRRSSELPFLAVLYQRRADMEELRSSHQEALGWTTKVRDLWRRMGVVRREAHGELRLSRGLLLLDRGREARALMQSVRERFEESVLAVPAIATLIPEIDERIRQIEEERSARALDGQHAFLTLEEILRAEQGPGEKLRAILTLMGEALGADGAVLGRIEAQTLEVISTVSMGRLRGRRSFPISSLGMGEPARAQLLRAPWEDEDPRGGISAMVIPAVFFGREHVVYLERRSPARAPFGRAELDYALVLLTNASRRLLPIGAASASEQLGKLEGGIWLADVITQNSRMLSILGLIQKVGDSDLTVLLQGETGTGKKLLAQAIHRTSGRRGHPFVTVDCAALPDSLLESELFGHRKGAFTGAIQDRVGLLEEANGGTIFLDEIDKAGQSVQRRFLHMLDSGEVRPVGSTAYRRLDVRVVCATSCPDLAREVAGGQFLKDLYYRLNDISITVPPLRERADDVSLLADCFVGKYAAALGRDVAGVAPAFHEALCAHTWPGNVRELEKAIKRAVTLVENGGVLVPALLPAAVLETTHAGATGSTLREKLERFERGLISEVLDQLDWNKSRAAASLGLSRKGLKSKIQRYRLDRRHPRRS